MRRLVDECAAFPNSAHDDQVDAAFAGADAAGRVCERWSAPAERAGDMATWGGRRRGGSVWSSPRLHPRSWGPSHPPSEELGDRCKKRSLGPCGERVVGSLKPRWARYL